MIKDLNCSSEIQILKALDDDVYYIAMLDYVLSLMETKNFCRLLSLQKLNTRKFLTHVSNFRHLATWWKLNVWTFLMWKKSYTKIFWSMVCTILWQMYCPRLYCLSFREAKFTLHTGTISTLNVYLYVYVLLWESCVTSSCEVLYLMM